MNDVKKALTRKLGPLPAWGWAVVAFVAVYWYRNRSSAQSLVNNTGGSNQPGAITTDLNPQPQTVLQPGESVYDPNTGGFITAPGDGSTGGDTGAGTGGDTGVADAINNLVNALETGNGQAVNLPPDSNSGSTTGGHGPGKRHKESSPKKPGRWSRGSKGMDKTVDHRPGKSSKRTPKDKKWGGQSKSGKTNKTDRSTSKGHDNHRANIGGTGKPKTTTRPRTSGGASVGRNTAKSHPASPATNARSRPTTGAVRTQPTVQQRPAATHPVAHPAPPPPKPKPPPPPPRRRGR